MDAAGDAVGRTDVDEGSGGGDDAAAIHSPILTWSAASVCSASTDVSH